MNEQTNKQKHDFEADSCAVWQRQYSQLEGKENFIMEQLSKKYAQYLSQYRHLVVDERSNTHLQVRYSHCCGGQSDG